jgi:hypothetical protein
VPGLKLVRIETGCVCPIQWQPFAIYLAKPDAARDPLCSGDSFGCCNDSSELSFLYDDCDKGDQREPTKSAKLLE